MKAPELFVSGKAVRLGKKIGKGGEGDVYLLETNPAYAVKVYTVKDVAEREKKVDAMVKARIHERAPLVAFPTSLVHNGNGRFAGFIMKVIAGHKPLHELYRPSSRKQKFPSADYRFIVRTAINVAKAMAQVHVSGCVIGDVNHSGILISDAAVAALIDADSFQFSHDGQRFLCRVGVPEFTPPELQGKQLSTVVRTVNHDAFGLAVAIFLLLFMGRHPFAGLHNLGELPLPTAIEQFRFAYSLTRKTGVSPPPGASDLTDVPQRLAETFERAFSPQTRDARPSAADWVSVLSEFETSLTRCGTNRDHYYSRAARSCPWCDMENLLGLLLFVPSSASILKSAPTHDPGAAAFDMKSVWRAIEESQVPDVQRYVPRVAIPTATQPSSKALAAKKGSSLGLLVLIGAIVAGGAIFALLPQLWFLIILGGIGAAYYASSHKPDYAEFEKEYRDAVAEWESAVSRLKERLGWASLLSSYVELDQARVEYEQLPVERQRRISEYDKNRRSVQVFNFLDNYRISQAKIRNIGPARTAQLASFGVETAADVERGAIESIGIGRPAIDALLEWRNGLEKKFKYNPNPTQQDQVELSRIEADITQRASALRAKLSAGAKQFPAACNEMLQRARGPDAYSSKAAERVSVAIADLEHLGIPRTGALRWPPPEQVSIPTMRASSLISVASRGVSVGAVPKAPITPTPSQSTAPSAGQYGGTPSCPNCGAKMARRVARRGPNAGGAFWGCTTYPRCRGTRPI